MVIIVAGLVVVGLFLLQKRLYRRWWSRKVSVELKFEREMVQAGGWVKLLEILENRKWLPLPALKIKFQCSRYLEFPDEENGRVTDKYYRNDLFSMMPYRRITRAHKVSCPKRGYYGIDGIDLVGADLFFSQEMIESRESNALLYVIPKALQGEEVQAAVKRINGEVAARRYELEDPFTYRGIREYEPQDELKTINWKATARTGDFKVNMREHTCVGGVRLFMNLEDSGILRREELLEMSISLCAALAENFLRQGIRVSIYANARDCITGSYLYLEEQTDIACMEEIDKALARLRLEEATERFAREGREKFGDCFAEQLTDVRNTLYTVFISPDRHEDYQQTLSDYRQREAGEENSFVWLCPVKRADERKVRDHLQAHTIFVVEEA